MDTKYRPESSTPSFCAPLREDTSADSDFQLVADLLEDINILLLYETITKNIKESAEYFASTSSTLLLCQDKLAVVEMCLAQERSAIVSWPSADVAAGTKVVFLMHVRKSLQNICC